MLTVAHVGDSRAYRLRDGHFEQLTEDHSLVAGLVKLGKLTPAEAARHPQRSVILRAIGVESTVEIDVLEIPLEDGDLFLLCSDGLSGMIQDEVIKETLASEHSLSEMAEMLIDLANEAGGKDNITVVLFRVGHA
jgi:protein phosphatase